MQMIEERGPAGEHSHSQPLVTKPKPGQRLHIERSASGGGYRPPQNHLEGYNGKT